MRNARRATSFHHAWHVMLAAVALAALLCPAHAAAGPPYQTDDPEPVAHRRFEVNISSQYANTFGAISGNAPALGVNYGLMPNVQLSLTLQLNENSGSRSAPWKVGFGDTTVGLKMRFVQETARGPQIAFDPAIVIPTGDAKNGLGGGLPKLILPLWLQKDVGAWTLFGGGGITRNPGPGRRDYTFTGVAAQRQMGRNTSFGAEIFHATADTIAGNGSTGFNIGSVRTLDATHSVMFSIGPSNSLSAYAGYKLQFGPRPKSSTPAAAETGF